jgi:hypothetical protein
MNEMSIAERIRSCGGLEIHLDPPYEGYAPIKTGPLDWRGNGGWYANIIDIVFPVCTGGSTTIHTVHILAGDYQPLIVPLSFGLIVCQGVMPRFSPGSLSIQSIKVNT